MSQTERPLVSPQPDKQSHHKHPASISRWKWLLPLLALIVIAFWQLRLHFHGAALKVSTTQTKAAKNDAIVQSSSTGPGVTRWSAAAIAHSIGSNSSVGFNDSDVHFATGSAALTGTSQIVLDQAALALRANPKWKIQIVGNMDSTSSPIAGQQLARQRAGSVMRYLTAHGVDSQKLSVDTDGDTNPVSGDTRKSAYQGVELVRE